MIGKMRICFLAAYCLFCIVASTDAIASRMLVDCGFGGQYLTTSPDMNGNHWNNLVLSTLPHKNDVASIPDLIDIQGISTGISVETFTSVPPHPIEYRGFLANAPPTGLLNPDPNLLGEFAIPSATRDYFYVRDESSPSGLRLSGLDSETWYNFDIFGSRFANTIRISKYTVVGANIGFTTLQRSFDTFDGLNDDEIASINRIRPNANGEIEIYVSLFEGDYAYVNALRITTTTVPEPPSGTLVVVIGLAMVGVFRPWCRAHRVCRKTVGTRGTAFAMSPPRGRKPIV